MRKSMVLGIIVCLLLAVGPPRVQAQIREAPSGIAEEQREEQQQAQIREEPSGIAEERKEEKEAAQKEPREAKPVELGGALLPNWRLVIEPFFEYDHISGQNVALSGFTIFESILIGTINITKLRRDIFIPGVNFRLGAFGSELMLKVPYLIRSDQNMYGGTGQLSGRTIEKDLSDSGIGDLELYWYYPLIKEGTWRRWVPDTIIRLGGYFPTGRDPYHLNRQDIAGLGLIPVQFPTGTGAFGTSGGVTFIKSADPAVLFLNLVYYYNFESHVGLAGSPPINFGNIKIGNTFEYSVGLIFALQERLSMNFSLDQKITGKTQQNGSRLADTQLDAIQFNIGATYMVSPRYTVDMVVAIGCSRDAPDVSAWVRVPISFQF